MGWGSGAEVMSDIIVGLQQECADDQKLRERLYRRIIPALQAHDWDTEMECVGEDAAFDAALRKLEPGYFEQEEA